MNDKEVLPQEKKTWYDKYYLLLGSIAFLLTILAVAYIAFFYFQHKDIMYKDVSLTGGTTITVYSQEDINKIKAFLPGNVIVRQLSDLQTGRQIAFSVETTMSSDEIKSLLEKNLNYNLTEENSSVEFTGPALSQSFYTELLRALIISFILMAIIVFFIFRTFIPSIAVIQAAFTDIAVSLAFLDFIGFRISSAGIAAFLMLIGYSVDTDILLTNRALRKEGSLHERMKSALITGLTMTLTSLVAVSIALLLVRNLSSVLTEIFTVLSVGLVVDMISTWFGNAAILKWYCNKKGIK